MVTNKIVRKITILILVLFVCLPSIEVLAQTPRIRELERLSRSLREQRERSARFRHRLDESRSSEQDKKENRKGNGMKKKKELENDGGEDNSEKGKQQESSMESGDVQLTIVADGATRDLAIQSALRTAIEQTFGTFVSSHTEILNDSLVKDEIATVASGNIKEFKCLSEDYVDGKCFVTVQAVVSLSNLVNYTKSKGGTAELAGATFAANMRLKELYAKNEIKAIQNLVVQLAEIAPMMFDYSIEVGEIAKDNWSNSYECSVLIKRTANANAKVMNEMLLTTLKSLSMTRDEYYRDEKIGMAGDIVGVSTGYPGYETLTDFWESVELGKPLFVWQPVLGAYLRSKNLIKELTPLQRWIMYCSMSYKIVLDGIGEYEMTFIPSSTFKKDNISSGYNDIYAVQSYDVAKMYFRLPLKYMKSRQSDEQGYSMGSIFSGNGIIQMPIFPNEKSGAYYKTVGYMEFSSLDEVAKISNIRVERVEPKLSYKEFLEVEGL